MELPAVLFLQNVGIGHFSPLPRYREHQAGRTGCSGGLVAVEKEDKGRDNDDNNQ